EFSFTVADLPGFCKVSCRTSSDVDTCGGEATVEDAISDFSCSTSDGSATKSTHDSRCTDGLNAYAHRSCYHIWISCECFRESNRYTCSVLLSSLPKFTTRNSSVSIYTLAPISYNLLSQLKFFCTLPVRVGGSFQCLSNLPHLIEFLTFGFR